MKENHKSSLHLVVQEGNIVRLRLLNFSERDLRMNTGLSLPIGILKRERDDTMPRSGKLKKVVVFGGGTGLSTLVTWVEKVTRLI